MYNVQLILKFNYLINKQNEQKQKMKKHFISLSAFAVWMLSATMLTSCGDDVQTPEKDSTEAENSTETTASTIFSTGNDGTRTSIDTDRHFYWEADDQIWVDTASNGSFKLRSSSSELSAPTKALSANFYFPGVALKGGSYDLTYTGNGSQSGTRVTIKATQTQQEWNDAAHIGTSGDCGVAEATRNNLTGTYKFSLRHQASYLIFQPYKSSIITDDWSLLRIEIIDNDGKALCGTYEFGMDGLNTSTNVTNTSSTVTLNCSSGGFNDMASSSYSAAKSCFAVIQPGSHAFTIRYYIKPTVAVNGYEGATFTIDKEVPAVNADGSRTYSPNGVTVFRHELGAEPYSPYLHYMWDAVNPYWYGVSEANVPKWMGASYTDYPKSASDSRNRWYNTAATAPTQASNSCRNLPNVNAMTWYVMAGDPRWETMYPWFFDGDGGAHVYTLGAWFLKWENIPGKPAGSTTTTCALSYRGVDGRSTALAAADYTNSSTNYKTKGRPAADQLNKYFFLPAMSHVADGVFTTQFDVHGCYWSASPNLGSASIAYFLSFTSSRARVTGNLDRKEGRVVAPSWFQ